MSISKIFRDLWDVVVFIATVIVPVLLALAALVAALLSAIAVLRLIGGQFRTARKSGGRLFDRLARAIVEAEDWIADATWRTLFTLGGLVFNRAGERSTRRLFRVTPAQASEAANNRLQFLQANLERAYTTKVFEVPPGVPRPILTAQEANLDRASALAQVVRLEYQASAISSSPELLLFARVTDALTCITRNARPLDENSKMLAFDVSLRRLQPWERRRRRFEWVALVGTEDAGLFRDQLERLQEWLGIGIDLARPLDVQLQRSCRNTPDNIGTIAGSLQSASGSPNYALTCSHVVPKCANRRFPALVPGNDNPDAALLKLHAECLIPQATSKPLRAATLEEVKNLHSQDKLVRRLGGKSRLYAGWVSARVASYPVMDGHHGPVLHEFPACIVKLTRNWYGPVLWPLFRRKFTRKGDSGSWVVVPKGTLGPDEVLLGMVHAGGIDGSYVILAQPLIKFFERLLLKDDEHVSELLAIPYEEN